jgi:hypothetical protein
LLGGCASGLVIMRGHLVSAGLSAIRFIRASTDYSGEDTSSDEKTSP